MTRVMTSLRPCGASAARLPTGAEASLALEAGVVVAEGGVQHVRAHENVGVRVALDVLPRVAQDEGVGVDGECVDAELRKLKHELNLVEAHLAKVGCAPSIIFRREAGVDVEGRDAVAEQPFESGHIHGTDDIVGLTEGDEVLDHCVSKVEALEIDVGGDDEILG